MTTSGVPLLGLSLTELEVRIEADRRSNTDGKKQTETNLSVKKKPGLPEPGFELCCRLDLTEHHIRASGLRPPSVFYLLRLAPEFSTGVTAVQIHFDRIYEVDALGKQLQSSQISGAVDLSMALHRSYPPETQSSRSKMACFAVERGLRAVPTRSHLATLMSNCPELSAACRLPLRIHLPSPAPFCRSPSCDRTRAAPSTRLSLI